MPDVFSFFGGAVIIYCVVCVGACLLAFLTHSSEFDNNYDHEDDDV
jgi:formate hydrogenlyase subunit 6/NADH:ubiquinone oxidoreductase subunit I